ncbi:conserved membrane hypothetical protein [Verrucomicrobia bacterium]|nr:conserved membrane hypothetical protein [Verrucomicrobiota bacterium]
MSISEAKIGSRRPAWRPILGRTLAILLFAATVGWMMDRLSVALERDGQPAGFTRGLLQGALMPMALPNLLLGKDVTIYAQNNTGLRYKLGYTAGVNGCGACFFGWIFWRINRWRKRPPS